MRTPLTAILGYSKLLEEGGGNQEQMASWQQAIVANSEYMANMVGNVLDLTALESGQLQVSNDQVELLTWTSELEALVAQRAAKKGLSFHCFVDDQVPSTIVTDRAKLTELVMNLLTNAVKYTFEGNIGLRISAARLEGLPAVNLRISDTGIGIGGEAQNRIFEPFMRVHDTESWPNIEGTGLGLSIVRHFVEALDGSISLASVLGEGTQIDVVIPDLSSESEGASAVGLSDQARPVESAGGSLKKRTLDGIRVLFCEDSETVATLVTLILEREGAVVTHAANGKLGIDCFSRCRSDVDVVITDIQMPVMDGYQFSTELREAGWRGPIIALTAFATENDANRCFAAGCSHYITKPIDVKTFPERVASSFTAVRVQSV